MLQKIISRILYIIGYILSNIAAILLWRRSVSGRFNVPVRGAVIIASNHISYIDPPMIGSSVFRVVNYLAKEELFRHPVFGWIIKRVNAIPIRRGESDIKPLRAMLAALQNGEAALVFPEGTRQRPGAFGSPKAGVGFLARQSGAPIVPALITGSDKYKKFGKVRVVFAEKIDYKDISNLTDIEISTVVMSRIKDMYERISK